MRIARFTTGDDPMYGIVQAKDGREMVYGITGDPLYTEIRPTGTILPLDDVRLLAPVIPRSKVVCVGRNYAEHAAELGNEVPEQALFFLKPNTAVIGPGEPAQTGSTADMIRSIEQIVSEVSQVMTLLPGDVILTGTPAGVRAVDAGSSMDVTIEGIGTLTNPVVRR